MAPEVRDKSGGSKAEYDSEEEVPQERKARERAHNVGRVLLVRDLDDFLESFMDRSHLPEEAIYQKRSSTASRPEDPSNIE